MGTGTAFTASGLAGVARVTLDPRLTVAAGAAAAEAPPLLLLPLRLEYRVVERQTLPNVADAALEPSRFRLAGSATATTLARFRPAATRPKTVTALLRRPVKLSPAALTAAREIWFRWYPDEGFAEKGIAAASPVETAALALFDQAIGARSWYTATDPVVAAAWQTLASTIGAARGVHLLRSRSAAGSDTGTDSGSALGTTTVDRAGRIAALPRRVALFAVDNDGTVTALGEGADIPGETAASPSLVSYTAHAIEPGGWLNSFDTALQHGMGLRLADAAKVDRALAAHWIVAVGVRAADGRGEIEALLRDAIASGSFAYLPQDAPTNNSAGTPSTYANPLADPLAFLQLATQEEAGVVAAIPSSAAELLGEALGIDAALARRGQCAADGGFEDTRAMLRVVAPALLDAALDGVAGLDGVDENAFINVLAGAVTARGPLPAVRFGPNPFGILPVTRLAEYTATPAATGDAPGQARQRVLTFLQRYATIYRSAQAGRADQTVPVLAPDDPQAPEKLEQILKVNPVSRRVEVSDAGAPSLAALDCPYVSSAAHPAAAYIKELRAQPIDALPDPVETDRAWPLLYRLARLSLVANTLAALAPAASTGTSAGGGTTGSASKTRLTLRAFNRLSTAQRAALPGRTLLTSSVAAIAAMARPPAALEAGSFQKARAISRDFSATLARLEQIANRADGTAQLETLLLEVLDLFQHRVDAWATGLAYARLVEQRRLGHAGLRLGYYGVLSTLRPTSVSGTGDGYIQAPSSAQAVTAAVLRSAHRRHRDDGAFAINLSSRRVRRALAILDLLKQSISLPEALGLRGERWLHDHLHDALIARLRTLFPLKNPTPPESQQGTITAAAQPVRIHLFNGLTFVEGQLTGLTAQERTVATSLKEVLRDDLDALSDLIMCEAVHQRALGQAEAANAWLQVMSGDPVPGDPAFLRTQRHGQGSSYRVSVLMAPASVPAKGVPREVAEPALAAFAARLLPSFAGATVQVTVTRGGGGTRQATLNVSLAAGLGLRPIDLVVGGESELRVRLRHHVVARWLADPALAQTLGALPATGLEAFLNRDVVFSFDLAGGSTGALITAAARLRAAAQHGRPLEPADLNAAASPAHPLTEAAEVTLLSGTVLALRQRATALMAQVERDRMALDAARGQFISSARETRRAREAQALQNDVAEALRQTEVARRTLLTTLLAASRWSEPGSLRLFTSEEVVAEPDMWDESLTALVERLAGRRIRLAAALAAGCAAFETHAGGRSALRTLTEALQGALDGEALPILPPVGRAPETTPLLDASQPLTGALDAWAAVREGVGQALDAVSALAGVAAYPVAEAATADETGAPETRGAEEAHRSRHFGFFLAEAAAVNANSGFTGIVCDEWVEQRPSRTQMAALAVNYDAPQSEPPHALLLCVPPNSSLTSWTEPRAAEMVWEMLQWMKTRALSTEHRLTPAALFPNANQVPFKLEGSTRRRRIPTRRYQPGAFAGQLAEGQFSRVTGRTAVRVGAEAIGLNEIGGRYRIKE